MRKVLVVDDKAKLRADLTTYLSEQGWTVCGAESREEASAALNPTYDAIILDLELDMNRPKHFGGIETLREIRGRRDLDSIPVIVYTQFDLSTSAVETLRLGAYQYILKDSSTFQQLEKALISGIAWQKAHVLRHQLLTSFNGDSLVEQIYWLIGEVFQRHRTCILFLDDQQVVTKVIPRESSHIVGTSPGIVTKIATSGRSVLLSTSEETRLCGPLSADSGSLLAVPIFSNTGGVAGVIDIESPETKAYDPNWVEVVDYLADLAGLSLEIASKVQEIEAKAREIEIQSKQLVVAEREKRRHVENLALEVKHQFSSPVQVIQLQAGELMDKEVRQLTGETRRKAEMRVGMILDNAKAIEGACRYLEGISEELPLHKEQVDIGSLLEVCREEIRPELESRHIRHSFRGTPPQPVTLDADPLRIRYSIQCLLKNAREAIDERRDQILDPEFKAQDGNDEVVISLDTSRPGWVTFSVRDTGVGVPPENQGRLFQPLFSTKRRPQTGGVGLFSVKRIIDSHGGKIGFSSEPGKGATFTVSLPAS